VREGSSLKEPVYERPATKYDGWYKLGHPPARLTSHNQQSWLIIEAILTAYGKAYFWDLVYACRHHRHCGRTKQDKGAQSWIRYCIRSGWLEPVD
jgi:hypothetical protein